MSWDGKTYEKYRIEHTDGTPLKGKKYFVLRLDSDDPVEAARVEASMRAYKGEDMSSDINSAAMRDALQSFVEYSELVCRTGMFNRNSLVAITEKARSALAAPPRNCDAFSKAEVLEVLQDRSFSKEDTVEWLYAAKGESDGSKQ